MSGRTVTLNIGPQHPGSGHMRIRVELDGDVIVGAELDVGYVHRGVEKIAEIKGWVQSIPELERPAILDSSHLNLGYVLAIEKLFGIEAPERARYLRTLINEINRIGSHLYGFGIFGVFLGSSTMYMWSFGDREVFLRLAEWLTGARVTHSYIIPGGVRRDLPEGFREQALKAVRYFRRRLRDYEKLFFLNPAFRKRLVGVGVLSRADAVRLGAVGPNLRASGVDYDTRRDAPYNVYDELDWEVAVREEGDCYARMMVRVKEMQQSMEIIKQVLERIPEGPILHERFWRVIRPEWKRLLGPEKRLKFPATFANLKPPKGTAFSRVEAARGELNFYVVSDGTPKPYRVRALYPSFKNLGVFKHLLIGARLADVPAIYMSLDYFPPEADR